MSAQYLVARFWAKVDVRRPGECWEWRAARNEHGYGIIRVDGSNVKAHRMALELTDGIQRAPDEKIRHTCDNPPCCNPAHLIPGSQAQNIADMHERGRRKYSSRFTTDDIEGMRDLRTQGLLDVTIAAMYGCSPSYVSMLISGARGASIGRTA